MDSDKIASLMSKRDGIPRGLCLQAINTFWDVVLDALEAGDKVIISRHLTLKLAYREEKRVYDISRGIKYLRGKKAFLRLMPQKRLRGIIESKHQTTEEERNAKNVRTKSTRKHSVKKKGKADE